MRRFQLLLTFLLLTLCVSAQDLLVKRNGEQLKVKVLSITKRKVQYVRQGTEMPVYSLPVSEIDYIQYPMGDRDTFGKGGIHSQSQAQSQPQSVAQQQKPTQSVEQPRPQSQDTSYPADTLHKWRGPVPPLDGRWSVSAEIHSRERTYSIGEIYSKDGVVGVVVLLTDGGRHGAVMSLDEACLEWCSQRGRDLEVVGASNKKDGMANMAIVEQYIAKNGLSWSDFPAFEWCRSKGEGWYLPSINELWTAGTMYLGGSRHVADRKLRKQFNESVTMAGGVMLSNSMYYYSSTEDNDRRYAHYTHMSTETPHTNIEFKGVKLFVRAFHKF